MGGKTQQQSAAQLFDAVRRGDAQKVDAWISNKKNRRPKTPLNFLRLSSQSSSSWLSLLLDSSGYTILHIAALNGNSQVVQMLTEADNTLLNTRDRRGCLPLHLACWNGNLNSAQILMDFDPITVDAVNNAKESPLHLASQNGHARIVAALLQHQATPLIPNARSETPLDLASRFGRSNIVRLLVSNCPELALRSAADIDKVVYPLHSAARNGHVDCMETLIETGFDINFVTDRGTALHVAALFGKTKAVALLLSKGVDISIRDCQGRTVIEVLDEHENEKATDLTQLMQNRDGWSQCRKLIQASTEEYSSQLSTDPYENEEIQLVWRNLPDSVAHRLAANQIADKQQLDSPDRQGNYYLASSEWTHIQFDNDVEEGRTSTISLSTTRPESEHMINPISQMEIQRVPGTTCTYQVMLSDEFKRDQLNSIHSRPGYDNVPSNLLVYDNAIPSRDWQHQCDPYNAELQRLSIGLCELSEECKSLPLSPEIRHSIASSTILDTLISDEPAPLALPEEMGASTSTSMISFADSPERMSRQFSQRSNTTLQQEDAPPPSADSSQNQIFETIFNLDVSIQPPSRSICSSNDSPTDDRKNWLICDGRERRDPVIEVSRKSNVEAALNECAEWQKIADIMSSFGGAIDRSHLSLCLKERHSQALSFQLNVTDRLKSYSNLSPIANWLQSNMGNEGEEWQEIADKLDAAGFDRVAFLKCSLTAERLNELEISESRQKQLLRLLQSRSDSLPSAKDFTYVSDWLLALDLEDYLGQFMKVGFISMAKICTEKWTKQSLKHLGITPIGHIERMVASLAAVSSPSDPIEWRHSASALITNCINYSAHYLGSVEISNIDEVQGCRRAMLKMKKGIREIAKVPQIQLEISVSGVRILDGQTKQLSSEHEINRILRLLQDDRDLNCFAYVCEDNEKYFCHVFSVLTADVAVEIIMSLGQAFDVAYRLATAARSVAQIENK